MPQQQAHTRREVELDFIRGVAIILVMVVHYRSHNRLVSSPVLERIQGVCWIGVDIFFVLSGFLVGGLMMKEWKRTGNVQPMRFLQRRAFKIWPAYYAYLLLALLAHKHPISSFFWQGLFNVQNYVPTTLGHTWSLAVEEHFYLLLSALLALWVSRRWSPEALLAVCLSTAVLDQGLRAFLALDSRSTFYYTHTRLDGLLLGVALAALRTFWPERFTALQRRRGLLLTVIGLAVWRLFAHNEIDPDVYRLISPTLVTFVSYASAALLLLLYGHREHHGQLYRFVARLGVYSYGIYLWHVSVEYPVDWVVARSPHGLEAATSTFLPYIMAVPVGIFSTRLIEVPFLRLRERFLPPAIPEPAIPNV